MILSLGVSSLFAEILLTASEINDLKKHCDQYKVGHFAINS